MEYSTNKYATKKVLFVGPGVDQLGRPVGLPIPGDIVKLHMTASYSALRPKFQVGGGKFKFGSVKMREKEFLSSHIVGECAFFVVQIPTTSSTTTTDSRLSSESPQQSVVADVLAPFVQGMVLGETAQFVLDLEAMDDKTKNVFFNTQEKLHKGQYKTLPADALKLTIVLDSYRIVRNKTEHRRPNRNGTGAKQLGSYM
jgi:hypothetical protein